MKIWTSVFALVTFFTLSGCNMEGASSGARSSRQDTMGISGPSRLLDGIYLQSSDCSFSPSDISREACQRSQIIVENGVGRGTLYREDFENRRVAPFKEYRRIDFSAIVNNQFNATLVMTNELLEPGMAQTFGASGSIWVVRGRLAQIGWDEKDFLGQNIRQTWHRQAGSGQTVGTEVLAGMTQEARQQAAQRQRSAEQAQAILSGVAAGLSGQPGGAGKQSTADDNRLWCENKTCGTPGCENYGGCKLR